MRIFERNRKKMTREIVNDFNRPLPYWSYTPIEYEDYDPLINLKEYLDKMLDSLFKTEIDSGNANVLDETINTRTEAAVKDLDRQRVRHREWIHNKFVQREGTKVRFEKARERAIQELEKINPEVEELREKYIDFEENGGKNNGKK